MKGIAKFSLLATLFLLQSGAYATSYYCSTGAGNGYINVGDSTDAVQQACGQPTSVDQREVRSQQTSATEFWLYENNEAQSSSDSVMPVVGKFQNAQQPTLGGLQIAPKSQGPTAVFKIENRQIVGISRNGIDTTTYSGCKSGGTVQTGGSVEQLIANCGQPSYVNVQNTSTSSSVTPTMVTTWTYDLGPYSPPIILQFENNKLAAINSGSK